MRSRARPRAAAVPTDWRETTALRILDIRERTVAVGASTWNAAIGFEEMTATALAVVTDAVVGGRRVVGFGLDSIGRYAHGGLLRERFIPRLLRADPAELRDPETGLIDPMRAWPIVMRGEKPGGHGERSAAVGVLDAALWDAAAKASDQPLYRLLAERFNDGAVAAAIPVYAAGGHYRARDRAQGGIEALADEVRRYRALGYRTIKIKIGGAPRDRDRARIEAALAALPAGGRLAVDANAVFDLGTARLWAEMLRGYPLAWFEEPGDPLDFALTAALAESYPGALATGENLFSAADARNLLRYGGLRPDRDLLQFDVSLSYGIAEYLRILAAVEAAGWPRDRLVPHAGHVFAAHVVAALGLGAHETAPDPGSLLAGFPAGWTVADGMLALGESRGVGFETMDGAYDALSPLVR